MVPLNPHLLIFASEYESMAWREKFPRPRSLSVQVRGESPRLLLILWSTLGREHARNLRVIALSWVAAG